MGDEMGLCVDVMGARIGCELALCPCAPAYCGGSDGVASG